MIGSLIQRLQLKFLLKNQFESLSLRALYLKQYQIEVGMYTYGCFDINRIPRGTKIGRYCSFSPTARIFNGNHGLHFLMLHPYVYNPSLGLVAEETIIRESCVIEDDVWLGHNVIITPKVRIIGRGAVLAAGAVVTKDVPPYAIVAGNPAAIIKYRFSEDIIEEIEQSKWWLKDKASIKELLETQPQMIFSPEQYFRKTGV